MAREVIVRERGDRESSRVKWVKLKIKLNEIAFKKDTRLPELQIQTLTFSKTLNFSVSSSAFSDSF